MAAARYSPFYTYIKPVIEHELVKSFLPYIFSLLTITVLIVFAIRPTVSTIVNLQKTLSDNEKILSKAEQKAQSLALGRQNMQNLDPQKMVKIRTALPQNPNVPHLVASLQNSLVSSASISALQIQPVVLFDSTEKNTGQNIDEISFSLNIGGNYPDLLATLDNLNKSSRIISINNMVLSKQSEQGVVLSVSGKAYYLK